MLLEIMRHEWRTLTADKTAWIVILAFGATIIYAGLNGASLLVRQQQAIDRFLLLEKKGLEKLQQRAGEIDSYKKSGKSINELPRYERYEVEFGPNDPRYAAAHSPLSAVLPPSPFSALAVGQTDIYPVSYTVSWWESEITSNAEQTGNPLKLTTGNFDLAFVLLYLYPLAIITITFNLLATEKESGILSLLLSQPITLGQLVAGKIAIRVILIFGCVLFFSTAAFLLVGVNFSSSLVLLRLAVWSVTILVYGTFWFALAIVITCFGKGSSTNALILIGCWIFALVLLPALLNLTASICYPMPSRSVFINAKREIPMQVEHMDKSLLRKKFFENHPEYKEDGKYTEWGEYAIVTIAEQEEVSRRLLPIKEEFDKQLNKQQLLIDRLKFLSPALLFHQVILEISGTSSSRQQHYQKQAEEYDRIWKRFFWPKFFVESYFSAEDYNQIPKFVYKEEALKVLLWRIFSSLILLVLLTVAFSTFGLVKLKNYPVGGS